MDEGQSNKNFYQQLMINQTLFGHGIIGKSTKGQAITSLDKGKPADCSKDSQKIQKMQEKQHIQTQLYQKQIKPKVQARLEENIQRTANFFPTRGETAVFEPQPFVWFEKKPFNKVVTAFQQQIINVPVQKVIPSSYEIQHRINYIKKEVTQIKPELQKRYYVDYRLNYVPVQTLIVHVPEKWVNNGQKYGAQVQQTPKIERQNAVPLNYDMPIRKLNEYKQAKKIPSKYFVTSPNYDYELQAKKWELMMHQIRQLKEKEKQIYSPHQIKRFI